MTGPIDPSCDALYRPGVKILPGELPSWRVGGRGENHAGGGDHHGRRAVLAPFVVAVSFDDLHGPTTGEVTLPNHLLWNPSDPFDLDEDKELCAMLRIVLREAHSHAELAEYVDRGSLIRLWSALGLPEYIRKAWAARFPELSPTLVA